MSKEAISRGDRGFKEMIEILKPFIKGKNGSTIKQVKLQDTGIGYYETNRGMEQRQYFLLDFTLENGMVVQGEITNLRQMIEERYNKRIIFKISSIIFWIGIFISILAYVINIRLKKINVKKMS